MIELIEEPEPEDADLESKEEDTREKSQSIVCIVHALSDYANLQTMKIDGFLKHQLVTILVNTGSINNFMDSKVETLLVVGRSDETLVMVRLVATPLLCLPVPN
ncbi:hypothetical protein BHE74_00034750 [Ensete ventricosum]|nr:hypothetical protein BHE74_00034750 [Ensete ventricosum]